MHLLDVPDIILEDIIGYFTYDEIAKMRMVCKAFNLAGQRLLNRGFITMERKHNALLRSVKSHLPRRESERRSHRLARHCDILTSIETRISMLSMTYSKYIDQNMCCFIPGKVIDEILRVLNVLKDCSSPPRAHEILQELRDISSMAIEHFDEKISPGLKQKMHSCTTAAPINNVACDMLIPLQQNITQGTIRQAFNKVVINKVMSDTLTKKLVTLSNELKKTNEIIALQRKQIKRQFKKIKNQNIQISELKRRMDDWEAKHDEISANVSQISNYDPTSPLRGAVSTSQVIERVAPVISQMLDSTIVPKNALFVKKSNMKPRTAQITLKRSQSMSECTDTPKRMKNE